MGIQEELSQKGVKVFEGHLTMAASLMDVDLATFEAMALKAGYAFNEPISPVQYSTGQITKVRRRWITFYDGITYAHVQEG